MAFDINGKIEQQILAGAEKYPRFEELPLTVSYGTAGFRMKGHALDFICFTVGILAGLRSRKVGGDTVGVMITASHNPAIDNGVKIVDPEGGMMIEEWEKYAAYLANAKDGEALRNAYGHLVQQIPIPTSQPKAHVIFARDTRPSGIRLAKALQAGIEAVDATFTDYGMLTTPQLHYLVLSTNTQDYEPPYGEASEEGYYKKMAEAFTTAMRDVKAVGKLSVDCANGIGAPKLKELIKYLPEDKLEIRVRGDSIDDPEVLNHNCGADYCKTNARLPDVWSGQPFDRWASFDGDADRVIYFYADQANRFNILDGDRIATLAASFIGELIHKAGLSEKLKIGVVQTAYANGASTEYIKNVLKLPVEFTNTGVKHLHYAAKRYDVGVYFEANGHGTVLFSPKAHRLILGAEPESPAQQEILETLRAVMTLINQCVGDAISDMLLVEVILAHREFTVEHWAETYRDLPNRLGKVKVYDRKSYITVDGTAEQKILKPPGIQDSIDSIVAKYRQGRSFVRASGTEDAVRVYGEAYEVYDCEDMTQKVMQMIAGRSASGLSQD